MDRGADPNLKADTTPLGVILDSAFATGDNHRQIAILLLQRGANPSQPDYFGRFPLESATRHSLTANAKVLSLLLEKGADPNRYSDSPALNGIEPKPFPSWDHDPLEKVKLLLAHGADPNRSGKDGRSFVNIVRNSEDWGSYERPELLRLLQRSKMESLGNLTLTVID